MGRPCTICCDATKATTAATMIAGGATDGAVAQQIGTSRMAVQRHRTTHLAGRPSVVMQQQAAAEQRAAALAAPPPPFDEATYLSRPRIAEDLAQLDRQLSVAIGTAALEGKTLQVVQLAAQQTRQLELRAKLGEVGGFGRERVHGVAGGGGYAIVFNFGGRAPETIATVARPVPPGDEPHSDGLPPVHDVGTTVVIPLHPLAAGRPAALFAGMVSPDQGSDGISGRSQA